MKRPSSIPNPRRGCNSALAQYSKTPILQHSARPTIRTTTRTRTKRHHQSPPLLYHLCGGLSLKTQLRRFEGVFLGHGGFSSVEEIKNQPAKERETDFPGEREMFLTVLVHDKQLVPAVFPGHIDIFPQFDIAIGTKNHGTAVAPRTEPAGSQPIYTKIRNGPAISRLRRITALLKFRTF